jgi:hypothetical protein
MLLEAPSYAVGDMCQVVAYFMLKILGGGQGGRWPKQCIHMSKCKNNKIKILKRRDSIISFRFSSGVTSKFLI